jgi:hypothetical protein
MVHSSSRRARWCPVFLAGLALFAGCTSQPTIPTASDSEPVRPGSEVATTIWRSTGSELVYVGSASAHATVTSINGLPTIQTERIAERRLGASEIERARPTLPLAALGGAQMAPANQPGGRGGLLRPSFTAARVVNVPTPDGKNVRLEFQDDPRGGGLPPLAMTAFVNGRLAFMNQMSYEKVGGKRRPTRARVTTFDSTGRVSLVTDNDLKGLVYEDSKPSVWGAAGLRDAFRRLGCELGRLASPTPLHAAVASARREVCEAEAAILAAAVVVQGQAAHALAVAIAACVSTGGACPAVIAASLYFLAATAAVAIASNELSECLAGHIPPGGGVGGGGGGGGGGGMGCTSYQLHWYISYDGGSSWHYLGSETVQNCNGDYET